MSLKRIAYGLMAAVFVSCAASASDIYDNENLESQILVMGAAHNFAFPISLSPEPISAYAAGSTAYSTNLGLKYTPPIIEAPGVVGAFPNTADGCGYTLTINGAAQKTRQDFLAILQDYEDDFVWSSFLGSPQVMHWNTDVGVSVHRGGADQEGIMSGTQVLSVGTHNLRWRAETFITPILDYPPWFILLAKPIEAASRRIAIGLKTPAARRAAMKALIQLAINLGVEGATFGVDWLLLDGVPTPAGNLDIANERFQTVRIFDTTTPVFSVNQPVFTVEATQVGGEFLRDHIADMREGFTVTDTCDRTPIVNYSGPSFLPVGETTSIRWTARDTGPRNINGGWNEAEFLQSIVVQDTMPPILLPPPGRVIESASAIAVEPGNPGVFDLADVRPVITNDAPGSFSPNSRTLVTWTATDASGNGTSKNQWITVKTPGSNTTPTALGQSVNTLMYEPTEIELSGIDNDLLSGRFDQLSFAITQKPSNGFFVAPLFPYFIEDHRVENEFGLNKFDLAELLDDRCSADSANYVPPVDFVTEPRYITVDDNGVTYVADKYFDCVNSTGRVQRVNRIARFQRGADGDLEWEGQIATGSNSVSTLSIAEDGRVYYRGVPVDSSTDVVRGCDANLDDCEVYRVAIDSTTSNPDRLFPSTSLKSMVADDNDVLYVTDGRNALAAYDLTRIDNNFPAVLGSIAGVGDLQSGSPNRKDLAIDPDGHLYLSDQDNDRVYKFAPSVTTRNADGSVDFTAGEFIGWKGRCDTNLTDERACDEVAGTSYGYTCSTDRCSVSQTAGSAPGQFNSPRGIAVDANGVLYVTDYDNLRVQRFTTDGFFAGEAQSTCDGSCFVLGDFGNPEDISANLDFFYVLDEERDLLHVFETTPITDFDDDTQSPTQTARVTYQSDEGFKGADQFAFTVGDGLATSSAATVAINVARNQRAPIATEGQVFEATEDEALEFRLGAFDPDPDDQPILTYQIEQAPENGTLSGAGPEFTYTPAPDFNGNDSFVFTVSDGVAQSEEASVLITVEPVNDVPVLTFGDMPDRFGAGFPIKAEVTFEDIDLTDRHVYGIDWGPGEPFATGRALPPGQIAGEGEPSFTQNSNGAAVLVDEATYFSNGVRTITVCASDMPGINALASCSDPRVTAVATRVITVEPMVSKVITIRDDFPSETDELGNEWPVRTVDGASFTAVFDLYNLEPNDVATVLDATDVTFVIQLEPGLKISANGLIALTGDGVNANCTISDTEASCTADRIPSGGSIGVALELVGDGTITGDVEVPVVAMATSAEPDHGGMVGNAKGYPFSINPTGDADGDGVANQDDAFPGDPGESADFDGDGTGDNADIDDDNDTLSDLWEQRFGLNPRNAGDAGSDPDSDGLSNSEEFALGSRPDTDDSDGDGVADNADNCAALSNANQYDADSDGLGDLCDDDFVSQVANLGDINADGTADFALLAVAGGEQRLYIKDGAVDESLGAGEIDLGAVTNGAVRHVVAIDGGIGVLSQSSDGRWLLAWFDALTGTARFDREVRQPDDQVAAMVAGDGELWLGVTTADSSASLQRFSVTDGAERTPIAFGGAREVLAMAQMGSGDAAMALLDLQTGELVVEMRAAADGALLSSVIAGGGDTIKAMLVRWADGVLAISQSTTGEILAAEWLPDGSAGTAFSVSASGADLLGAAIVTDAQGENPLLGVLSRSGAGAAELGIYDPANGSLANTRSYGESSQSVRGLAGNDNEPGVLFSSTANEVTLELADPADASAPARTLNAEATTAPPPPPPTPTPTPTPNPTPGGGGGGGGALGSAALLGLLLLAMRRRYTSSNAY